MTTYSKIFTISLLMVITMGLNMSFVFGQEANPNLSSKSTYHNQLFFNRFLINPTFSLVRENKSYLNILHRNQYATFEDNNQNYFLGFSNRLNENTALGIGVYSQWAGVVQEFGFNANYATAVRLSDKSKLTFGANVTYFNEGLDKNRVVVTENDPEVGNAQKESKVAVQPAITLSVGKFDFGLYAEDLVKYNQTTNEFLTQLNDKSIKASLQYTHTFDSSRGFFENARLMPLVQMGKNLDGSLAYLGSVLLDLPNYGWFQSTIDDRYGMSMGLGFNLNKKMSIGYLMEKDLRQKEADLGWNHELSLAYTFKNDSDNISLVDSSQDAKIDRIVRNYEEQILRLTAENSEKEKRKKKNDVIDRNIENSDALAYENRLILDELIFRQDSIEEARAKDFEKRFETIVRILRNDLKQTIDSRQKNYSAPEGTTLVASNEKQEAPKKTTSVSPKKYEKLPIKVLDQSDIIGVKSGYYVIANVYKSKKYLNAFMATLKEQGLDAKKFYNKENGLYYVYLADFNYKQDAQTAFVSNLDGKYRDEKWIMQVNSSNATAANIYTD
ncbi:MAG: PorP/SprF family type IX secretion system membrane protein [Maribacter sp.]|nr:PorP/SprF family type IX secretion system membrane protein [Maribacter sp.]MBT8302703.1 PorP/SprF family type IX secretion system membrane protein [Maribacter sp.]NNK18292.1 PorP/SprF family type IX secretion system membrane protein [Maribacter sp.]